MRAELGWLLVYGVFAAVVLILSAAAFSLLSHVPSEIEKLIELGVIR